MNDRMKPTRRKESVEGGGVVGFVFGLVIGTAAGLSSWTFAAFQPWYAVIAGIITGALAYVFGDRLWVWLGEKLRWFS